MAAPSTGSSPGGEFFMHQVPLPLLKAITRFPKENLELRISLKELMTEIFKKPHFYLKPKIHKKGNPRRPAICLINCHTSKISEYVDYHFQIIVTKSHCNSKTQPTSLGKQFSTEWTPTCLGMPNHAHLKSHHQFLALIDI